MNTVNYPSPVMVNGYSCKNCTDVDNAKRHIDPQHPKDGPFGINRLPQPGDARPTDSAPATGATGQTPAVTFGGALSHLAAAEPAPATPRATQGHRLDLSV